MGHEREIRRIATGQHGVVHRRQALAVGMTDRMIQRRLATGAWVRIKPGTFLLHGYPQTTMARLAGAVAALPAVVSHEAAAELHRLPDVPRGRAVVTVPLRCTHRFPDVVVH